MRRAHHNSDRSAALIGPLRNQSGTSRVTLMQRQNALELSNMYPKPRTSPVGAPPRTGSDRSLAQLQIQRTEIGMRRGRQPGSTKATCPVCVLIADGPDQERSTEWVCVRFNIDARPEDQLFLTQLTRAPASAYGANRPDRRAGEAFWQSRGRAMTGPIALECRGRGCGGWGGIRTHGTVARTPVFKTGALNHSATHPLGADQAPSRSGT